MHMCNLNDEDTGKQWQIVEIYIKFYAKKKKKKKKKKNETKIIVSVVMFYL
jgi:hypothetical protein